MSRLSSVEILPMRSQDVVSSISQSTFARPSSDMPVVNVEKFVCGSYDGEHSRISLSRNVVGPA